MDEILWYIFLAVSHIILLSLLARWIRRPKVGRWYSFQLPDGRFGLGKVIAVDSQHVFMRFFSPTFSSRPSDLTPEQLEEIKNIRPYDYAVLRKDFVASNPEVFFKGTVTQIELMSYHAWKSGLQFESKPTN